MKNVILQNAIALVACLALASTATANPPQIFDYVAKETRAIDRGHFTQGLSVSYTHLTLPTNSRV